MKIDLKTPIKRGVAVALVVACSMWLSCSQERKPDPEMERLNRILEHSKEQMDAISKMCDAISEGLKATNAETRLYWQSNMMYWSDVGHAAYQKLKNN